MTAGLGLFATERDKLHMALLTGEETSLTRRQALMLLDDLVAADAEIVRLRAVADAALVVSRSFSPDEPLRLTVPGTDAADSILALRACLIEAMGTIP